MRGKKADKLLNIATALALMSLLTGVSIPSKEVTLTDKIRGFAPLVFLILSLVLFTGWIVIKSKEKSSEKKD